MVEPITGAALVGAGWFANKILGPSADSLGEQLRNYLTVRMQKIFNRASELANPAITNELPPGFIFLLTQQASFSEDTEEVTEMWANLLVAASEGFDRKHHVFADILGQIGSDDAKFLDRLVNKSTHYDAFAGNPANVRRDVESLIIGSMEWSIRDYDFAHAQINKIFELDNPWPVKILAASWPYYPSEDEDPAMTGVSLVYDGMHDAFVVDSLIRQRLIEYFKVDFSKHPAAPSVSGILLTSLGAEFVCACRGIRYGRQ